MGLPRHPEVRGYNSPSQGPAHPVGSWQEGEQKPASDFRVGIPIHPLGALCNDALKGLLGLPKITKESIGTHRLLPSGVGHTGSTPLTLYHENACEPLLSTDRYHYCHPFCWKNSE